MNNYDKRETRKIKRMLEKRMIAAGMKHVLFTDVQVLQFLRSILKREFKATDIEINQMIKNPVKIKREFEVAFLRMNPDIAYEVVETAEEEEVVEVPVEVPMELPEPVIVAIKKKGKK